MQYHGNDYKIYHPVILGIFLFFCMTAVDAALPPPLLQYDFEDSQNMTPYDNIIRDSSGNNLHSVLSQTDSNTMPLPGSGKNGLGLVFDSTAVLDIGDHALLDLNEFTTATWLKYEHFPEEIRRQEIYEKADAYWMNIRQDTSKLRTGGIFRTCLGATREWVYVDSQSTVPENTWVHVAASYDGLFLRVYINGQLEGEAAAPNPVCDNNQPLIIGGKHGLQTLDAEELVLTEPEAFFNGAMDAFRIYTQALTVTQIQEVMNETAGLTLSTDILTPQPDEAVTAPVTITGTGSAPDGVDTVLVGIRDQVQNLWWNNGSWGIWLLDPATVTPSNPEGTAVHWTTHFDPTGTTGSGEYRIFAKTRDINGILSDSATLNFTVTGDINPVPLAVEITAPQPGETITFPVIITGTGSAPDGVDTILVGIRDQVQNLWWNNGSWGAWLLYPTTVSPTSQDGTEVDWTTSFDPTAVGGSGEYRIFARTRDVNGSLSDATTVNFQGN